MTIKNVLLSETLGDFVTDFNGLSSDVGDLTLLTTSAKNNIVAAINELVTLSDSAAIQSISRASVSVTDAGGDGSLTYSSATGVITYTGPSATEVRAHLSAGARLSYSSGQFNVANAGIDSAAVQNNAITSAKLASAVTLIIYNSAGTAVKTLYGAGS